MVIRKSFKFLACISLLFFVVAVPTGAFAKDKIVFGGARPLSGGLAFFEASSYGPVYKLWAKDVNDKGGIYVKQYKKKLPIESRKKGRSAALLSVALLAF